MIYHKFQVDDRQTVINEIYDDEFVAYCPVCGKEHQVEPRQIADILTRGDDFSGTSVYCNECFKRDDFNA